jgi:hypothetical protein
MRDFKGATPLPHLKPLPKTSERLRRISIRNRPSSSEPLPIRIRRIRRRNRRVPWRQCHVAFFTLLLKLRHKL